MCGIAGFINFQENQKNKREIIINMAESMAHRGPNEEGFFISDNALLGHKRLTVVDPEGGKQPMQMGFYTMVYNGELYNTDDIRAILINKGYKFKSHSDTEVLLVSYIEWGMDCVYHLNGIYAFAVWDDEKKSLYLARDRMGVKPLFYAEKNGNFIFASEIKGILQHPDIEASIDEAGIMSIFALGPARPSNSGIFKGIYELPPACFMCINAEKRYIKEYWHLESNEHNDSEELTKEKLRELFENAVERQLVSDVPLVTFLSGGLDSSAISSIAAKIYREKGRAPLETYSIDYEDNSKYFKASLFQPDSDSEWTQRAKDEIQSVHHNIIISSEDLAGALKASVLANDLPGMADVDSSLYLFCKEVRKNATVALSGECADEIFGGYPWFRKEEMIWANTFPWSRAIEQRKKLLSAEFSHLPMDDYVNAQYQSTLKEVPHLDGESKFERRMREISYLNLKWFMLTLLSRKDRMSMANSLEVRVPFADHRLVEYAWNIPIEMKYLEGREKGLLRHAFKGLLSEDILWRKKSPYPKTHNPKYLKIVTEYLKDIANNPNSPLMQIADKNMIKTIIDTGGEGFGGPFFGQLMAGPQLIAYLVQINEWLVTYKIKIC